MSSSIQCPRNDVLVLTGGDRKSVSYKNWRHAHRDWGPTQSLHQPVETLKDLLESPVLITSTPSRRDGWQLLNEAKLCLEPTHRSSVFSVFSFSRLADNQRPISVIQSSSLRTADATPLSGPGQRTQTCESSANEWKFTWQSATKSARSAVYMINTGGPRTEPCGTEQSKWTTNEDLLPKTTLKDLLERYDPNHRSVYK